MTLFALGSIAHGARPAAGVESADRDDGGDFSTLLPSPESLPPPRAPAPAPRNTPHRDDDATTSAEAGSAGPQTAARANERQAHASQKRQDSGRPDSDQDTRAQANRAPADTSSDTVEQPAAPGDEQDQGLSQDLSKPTSAASTESPWPPAGLGGLEVMLAPTPMITDSSAATATTNTPLPAPASVATGSASTPGLQSAAAATSGFAATVASTLPPLNANAPSTEMIDALSSGDVASPLATATTADAATLFALSAAPASAIVTAPANTLGAVFDGAPTPTPNLHEGFDDAIGARMSWLADQKIGHAHIQINPGELGPIEVRLQLDGDKVQASFCSAHADVRQALEQSLPRLREMLGQQGLQLAHTDVGSQQTHGRATDGRNDSDAGTGDAEIDMVGGPSAVLRQRGLLDAYA